MKKLVLTIREDICDANGKKEENVNELVEKMALFGTVTDFDDAVKTVKEEYQDTLNKITAQLNKIRANELSNHEIFMLNALRKVEAEIGAEKDAEIKKYVALVDSINSKMRDMINNVREAVKDE